MSTYTAQILIGRGHPYDGGVIHTHQMFLQENGISRWILSPQNVYPINEPAGESIVWIPTPDHMLEDALLMIGLYVLKDERLIQEANMLLERGRERGREIADHYLVIAGGLDEELQRLYALSREIKYPFKIVVVIIEKDASINKQLHVLEQYDVEVSVSKPTYSKVNSILSGRTVIRGSLSDNGGKFYEFK